MLDRIFPSHWKLDLPFSVSLELAPGFTLPAEFANIAPEADHMTRIGASA